MIADLCFHDKGDGNPHVHIMLTMRPFNEDGSWGAKQRKEYISDEKGGKIYDPKKRQYKCKSVPSTDWNDREKAEQWRAAWAGAVNAELAAHGFAETVDHRSYERQGIDKVPSVHLGVSATQMERRGIKTDRGNFNRQVEMTNAQIRQLRARIVRVETWADGLKSQNPLSMYDVYSAIADAPTGTSVSAKNRHIQLMSKTLLFLEEHGRPDLFQLSDIVHDMHGKCNDLNENNKKVTRRIDTLKKHLEQSGHYKRYRKVSAEYDRLRTAEGEAKKAAGLFAKSKHEKTVKERQDFYRDHESEIGMFRDAEKYLRSVLQSRFDPKKSPPIAMWQKELAEKTGERDALTRDFHKLREEIKNAEAIKRYAVDLMIPNEPQKQTIEPQKQKTWEVEI
jgi:hypothetical protein